jgi:hypothetical protein
MKRRLFACVLVIVFGVCGCGTGSPDSAEAVVTSAATTTETFSTITAAETTTEATTTVTTTAASTASPIINFNTTQIADIDDIIEDIETRNEFFNVTDYETLDINNDNYNDYIVLSNSFFEVLFSCYLYNGETYNLLNNIEYNKMFNINQHIFKWGSIPKDYKDLEIKDFLYEGKTYKTIVFSQQLYYQNLNYIVEPTLDSDNMFCINPLISFGIVVNETAKETLYERSYFQYISGERAEITPSEFWRLTGEYFEDSKDFTTFIPPECDFESILKNSVNIDDVLYYYDDYQTIYLIKDNEIIDTMNSRNVSSDFFYSSIRYEYETTLDFDIPPYFVSRGKMFNVFNDKISEVKFIFDGKNIYDSEPYPQFLHYVLKTGDRSFIVYIEDMGNYSIGINGKIEFTYNPENNCFEGEYIDKISSEAEQIARDLYIAADTLEDKVTMYYYVETEYSLSYEGKLYGDPDKIVEFDDYDYSKIVEEGFRTRDELIATLNTLYTPEYSEEIYKRWTDKSDYSPSIIEKDNELYLYIPGGLGDNEWGEPCFDIISADEDTIVARIVMLDYRSGGTPYFNVVYPENVIIKMTPNGYRISQIPFM